MKTKNKNDEKLKEVLDALEDVVFCIRDFQAGDYSPMMDELFDAEFVLDMSMKEIYEDMKYVIQKAEKSFCPKCNKSVDLLCRKDGDNENFPWFYICFDCKLVAEVGRGEVERE